MSSSFARATGLIPLMLCCLAGAPAQADVGYAAPRTSIAAPSGDAALAARVAAQLQRALPAEKITVRTANAGLVLSGQVSGPEALDQALALAARHAPGRVANLMTSGGTPMITLTLGLAEMPPSVARNLTASMAVAGIFALETSDPGLFGGTGAMPGLQGRDLDLPGLVAALEAKGVLRLHAGPVLSVRAGDGTQLPAGTGCATATGQGLGLTTSLTAGGRMSVKISPCPSVGVPGDPVVIALQDGQTIAIAGVLPARALLMDDPVFGAALAPGGTDGLTEMMLLISARIVAPEPGAAPQTSAPARMTTDSGTLLITPVAADGMEPFTLSAP